MPRLVATMNNDGIRLVGDLDRAWAMLRDERLDDIARITKALNADEGIDPEDLPLVEFCMTIMFWELYSRTMEVIADES